MIQTDPTPRLPMERPIALAVVGHVLIGALVVRRWIGVEAEPLSSESS